MAGGGGGGGLDKTCTTQGLGITNVKLNQEDWYTSETRGPRDTLREKGD